MPGMNVAESRIQQGVGFENWYQKDGKLVTKEGDIVITDCSGTGGTTRTVKKKDWTDELYAEKGFQAVTYARTKCIQSLVINTMLSVKDRSIKASEVEFLKMAKEMIEDLTDTIQNNEIIQRDEDKLRNHLGPCQDLGKEAGGSWLNNLEKLKILNEKTSGVDQNLTLFARNTLKDLFKYGFFRFAVKPEFREEIGYAKPEEVLAYQTKTDDGDIKLHVVAVVDFLKAWNESVTFDTAEGHQFIWEEGGKIKSIALAMSKFGSALPGKDVVKFD